MTVLQRSCKRGFDIVFAFLGIVLFGWLIAFAWLAAALDTRQGGFFVQRRIGRFARPFNVIKVRTMRKSTTIVTSVSTANDPRITRLGSIFRRWKIDELPQLFNVLAGSMSFVGPRPDVPGFADQLQGADRIILEVRPGITGPATLKYRDEEQILANVTDPEQHNRDVIYPDKVRLNREYVENYSFRKDLYYLYCTVASKVPPTRS